MKYSKCKSCKCSIPPGFDQNLLDYVGKVNDISLLDDLSKKIELDSLKNGNNIYYYYDEITLQYIADGEPPTASLQQLCEDCLRNSLLSPTPHYGDGVYFSAHPDLYSQNTSKEVVDSHGIGVREFKATYMCLDNSPFIKINKSGGVLRSYNHSIKDNRACLTDGVVLLMSISD